MQTTEDGKLLRHPTHYFFEPGGRPFRSRKNRPCDCCRRTKTRCTIGPDGPPCFECIQTKKNCTFEEGPPVRKSRALVIEKAPESTSSGSSGSALHALAAAAGVSRPVPTGTGKKKIESDTTGLRSSGSPDAANGNIHPSPRSVTSLDSVASESYEPHVLTAILTDDLLPISTGSNHPGTAHARQVSTESQRPVYVVFAPRPDARTGYDPGVQVLYRIRTLLKALPSCPKEESLLETFLTHVHPAFPILPLLKNMGEFPPYLLSAIYATAMNHRKEYRELSAAAWSFVHAPNIPEVGMDSPRLSTIAAALMDIGSRPVVDPRGNYLTLAKTIAHAQLLGLHLDPTKWSIPTWEKDLRIRLWWGLKIHDAWMSFLNSRPSHMQKHNSDNPLPSPKSLESAVDNPKLAISCQAFSGLCRLSEIVACLQNEICTIKSQKKQRHIKLNEIAALERETDELAKKWQDQNANRGDRKPGVQSLILHILCFRCMLRRIYIETESGVGGPFRPDQDTLNLFTTAVNFITSLSDENLDEFWLCYSSHVISSLLSSLIRISLVSMNHSTNEGEPASSSRGLTKLSARDASSYVENSYAHSVALHLASRLIAFLRRAREQFCWDVADPALLRATSVIARLKTWDESKEVSDMVFALEGKYFSFPDQPMQWQQDCVPEVQALPQQHQQHQQQPQPQQQHQQQQYQPQQLDAIHHAQHQQMLLQNSHPHPGVISEVALASAPLAPNYSPNQTHLHHQHIPSPPAVQQLYDVSPSLSTAAANTRSPTPPQHVPVMYAERYSDGATVLSHHAAGQTPPSLVEASGEHGIATELGMLGMDGVTFWTPWMSNIGLDGNVTVDENLSNYVQGFSRPAGW